MVLSKRCLEKTGRKTKGKNIVRKEERKEINESERKEGREERIIFNVQ